MMTETRFPRRRDDGSFVVSALFISSEPEICALVGDYVAAWTRANKTWVRVWRSNRIEEECLEFCSEFSGEPRVECNPDGRSFQVVLEGRSSATRWKDWAVLMVDDISKVFPEVEFVRFDS
jgi:hypothetical protein